MCTLPATQSPSEDVPRETESGLGGRRWPMGGAQELGFDVREAVGNVRRPGLDDSLIV